MLGSEGIELVELDDPIVGAATSCAASGVNAEIMFVIAVACAVATLLAAGSEESY